MIDKTITSYTRSVLKADTALIGKLGKFEVYFNKTPKAPKFNYIVLRMKRSKRNDPVQDGFFYIELFYLSEHQENLVDAANIIESLLDELVFPGGGAIRMFLRDLDFWADPERKVAGASMMFSFRGNNLIKKRNC